MTAPYHDAFPATPGGSTGLCLREYFAARAMQGMLAHGIETSPWTPATEAYRRLASASVQMADELIAALNGTASQPVSVREDDGQPE